KNIYDGMFTQIDTMNKEQLEKYTEYVTQKQQLETESYDKSKAALDRALEEGMVSEEDYNRYIGEMDAEALERKQQYGAEMIEIAKAKGASDKTLAMIAKEYGLEVAELEEMYAERIRKS